MCAETKKPLVNISCTHEKSFRMYNEILYMFIEFRASEVACEPVMTL
jgi:hypothetical protein